MAWYAAPYEPVIRLLVLPGAVATAVFPAFAAASNAPRSSGGDEAGGGRRDVGSAVRTRLYEQGIKLIWLARFSVSLVIVAFAREGLLV